MHHIQNCNTSARRRITQHANDWEVNGKVHSPTTLSIYYFSSYCRLNHNRLRLNQHLTASKPNELNLRADLVYIPTEC
jgi:hypothetical protein